MNLYQMFWSCRLRAKKKVLGVYINNSETYTRHSGIADEVLGSNFLFKPFKGGDIKKSQGNPVLVPEKKILRFFKS